MFSDIKFPKNSKKMYKKHMNVRAQYVATNDV